MACVFIELGQDAHIDGDLTDAVNEGVRRGYEKAFLRKSITADPLQRVNTGDNTPAFLTVHLVPGSGCKITVAPKGAGSENMSRLAMLKPADGVEGVKNSCLTRWSRPEPIPVRPLCWVSASAAASTTAQRWPKRHCCARWTNPTPTRIMQRWKRNCWTPSTPQALARRLWRCHDLPGGCH